jgi:undecaprenyl-diphosphatase
MTVGQTLIFAVVQGITELFPISSVGHAVILPYLLHWTAVQNNPTFLPFIVMLHVGTAIALLIFFWKDWLTFIRALFARRSEVDEPVTKVARKEFGLLVVGTIPAVLIGEFFNHPIARLFAAPQAAMVFLIVNGVILIAGDRLLRRTGKRQMVDLTLHQIIIVGILEAFALIPGFSRSALTMIGGLMYGLKYESAARLSFLLATPIILGAGVKEIPKLHHLHGMLGVALIGGVAAGIAAYASTWFLMRYFKRQEVRALRPFGIYCVAVGALTLLYSIVIV